MTRPDARVCDDCGMPLAYDRVISNAVIEAAADQTPTRTRCSYCAQRSQRSRRTSEYAYKEAPWALDLILDLYQHRAPIRRTLAASISRWTGAPVRLRTLAKVLHVVPRRTPRSTYDAVVLFSGGKDSSYMLVALAKKRLRLCAWMLNQGYQSPIAIANAERLCASLGVPLVIDAPPKREMDQLFRVGFGIGPESDPHLLRAVMTYGSACWPCFATIAARATSFCAEHSVPFCFIGTQPGQNRLDVGGRPGLDGIEPRTEQLFDKFVGPISERAAQHAPDAAKLLTQRPCTTLLLPFYEFVRKPPAAEQIAQLTASGWKMPHNTGACSTNCMMNELGRHVMRERFGFDLYQVINAHERRLGNESPEHRDVAAPALDHDAVLAGAHMIGLSAAERQEHGLAAEAEPESAPARVPAPVVR